MLTLKRNLEQTADSAMPGLVKSGLGPVPCSYANTTVIPRLHDEAGSMSWLLKRS